MGKGEGCQTKQYIDTDVYVEAKKRIRHIIESFDNVLVAFSGGKDSLTTLCLTDEVYKEMGINEKVKVFFRDEEVIPDDVIDFVISIAQSGKYDFRYYAVPLKSTKFIMGQSYDYVQWDRNRDWVRQPPDFAIRMPDNEYEVLDQYTSDEYICQNEKGRVAILTGIRASESLVRHQACTGKRNENYITAVKNSKRIKNCKPIYDWEMRDVFLYFLKNDIKYCEIYDNQVWNRDNLRVATPFIAESSKKFNKVKTLYPKFYQQCINVFPEMIVQDRYWSQYEKQSNIEGYEHSFNGIRKYIYEHFNELDQRNLALKRVKQCETIRRNKGKDSKNYGGYPVLYVFKVILNGQYKRAIQPRKYPQAEDIVYEETEV